MATLRYLVNDVDAAGKFYTQFLGFTEVERWGPAFAILARDDLKLWLSGPQTSAAKPMPDGRQPIPGGWNRLVLEVKDIEALVANMRAANVVFRNDILAGAGGAQILAEDPSGNPIELFEGKS